MTDSIDRRVRERNRVAWAAVLVLSVAPLWAQAPTIPDVEVSGPPPGFEMDSRLMTSGKRMDVWLSVPEVGQVEISKFNGTLRRPAAPAPAGG